MKENEKSKNSLTSSNVQSPKDWSGRILELVLYALAFSAFNGGIYSLLLLQYTTGKWSNVAIIIGITGISLGLISILGGIEIRKSRKLLEAPIFHSQ